jgi:hypothetical protein
MAPCDTLKKLYLISMDEVFTTLARQVICDGKSNTSFVCHLYGLASCAGFTLNVA